ncbi:phospholipase D-like domain-containing protein [Granulicella cerasi]|uniref:Phospholipase D-like domain-containing protein n=2 Tax=Granulicella cerasi TaxID=741063 RepID=A0ABW1ZG52_9BACT
MLDIINNATTTLVIEAEELTNSASYITSAVTSACSRGVTVKIIVENVSHAYDTQMTALKSGGCAPRQYTSSSGFYVHAKAVVADYGLPTQTVYLGSINYSNASMTANRELGMNISDQASVTILYNTMTTDWNGAAIY